MAEPPLNGVAETGHRGSGLRANGTKSYFLLWLFAILGVYIVGVGASTTRFYCMIIAKINPILLCSHPHQHPKSNREVRRSLTWHSSKSESAL